MWRNRRRSINDVRAEARESVWHHVCRVTRHGGPHIRRREAARHDFPRPRVVAKRVVIVVERSVVRLSRSTVSRVNAHTCSFSNVPLFPVRAFLDGFVSSNRVARKNGWRRWKRAKDLFRTSKIRVCDPIVTRQPFLRRL